MPLYPSRRTEEVLSVFPPQTAVAPHPFNGRPIGLDHAAIPPTLRLMGIKRQRWPEIFGSLALCEDAVLEGRA